MSSLAPRPRPALLAALAAVFLLVVSMVSACGSSDADGTAAKGEARTIKHELGTTEITGDPQRVVALEYSFVDAVHELGVVPVGIADDDDPTRIDQLLGTHIDYTSVGTRLEPNLELIAGLKPDLIIADATRHEAIYGQLKKIAPTIVLNSWEGTYDTIKQSVVTIADALGDAGKGEQAVAEHDKRMAALKAQVPADSDRRVLLAVSNPEDMSLQTSASFTGSVFAALGLTPAIESGESTESGVGIERLVAVDPDVLFVATEDSGSVYDTWPQTAAWKQIAAAKASTVFEVDRNAYSRFRGLHTAEVIAQSVVDNLAGA